MSDSVKDGNGTDPEQLIQIPGFLSECGSGIAPASCSICELYCETSAMLCGECSGQSCTGQCFSSECGSCQSCQTTCQKSCQNCEGSACQSSCQSSCQRSCQGCESACEKAAQTVKPSFYISGIGSNSVTVYVEHGSGYSKFRVFVRYKDGNTALWDKWVSKTSNFSYTVTGLSPGMDYVINVGYAVDTSASSVDGWCGSLEFTTDRLSIEPWAWTDSNGSATAAQTKDAYSSVTGKKQTSGFSYLVWNDLIDKVKEVLDATENSWSNQYLSYSSTRMTSSDRTLTAARFNSLRFNIGSYAATGIGDVSRGDTVYGYYFTTLTSSLNQWINSL